MQQRRCRRQGRRKATLRKGLGTNLWRGTGKNVVPVVRYRLEKINTSQMRGSCNDCEPAKLVFISKCERPWPLAAIYSSGTSIVTSFRPIWMTKESHAFG